MGRPFTDRNGIAVKIGDPVMVIAGDKSVHAGAIGYIRKINGSRALVCNDPTADIAEGEWVWAAWMEPVEFISRPGGPAAGSPVEVDPELPEGFWSTPHYLRPESHRAWWGRPFIQRAWCEPDVNLRGSAARLAAWRKHWPSGTRFDVFCLDGQSEDGPSCWGQRQTLESAIALAITRRLGIGQKCPSEPPLISLGQGDTRRDTRVCEGPGCNKLITTAGALCASCLKQEIRA